MIDNIRKQIISSFLELIEVRDSYTAGHSIRVAYYSTELAKELKLNLKEIQLIHDSALLHDIGKIGTPDSILLKPGKLTIEEYCIMKEHVSMGFKTIKSLGVFSKHADIIKDHHEKFDGSGYPEGKKGDEISLYSYILSLADSFDALTTSRIYSKSRSPEEAVVILKDLDGKDFPQKLVSSLEKILLLQEPKNYKKQKPENKIEEEKYAFYFKDILTGVYSYSYLNYFILENINHKKYRCVYYFYLKNMTLYNKDNGWDEGNKLLKKFATSLKNKFQNSMIFRIKGDDFIVISKDHLYPKVLENINKQLFDSICVNVDIHHFDFFKLNIDSFNSFENIIYKELGMNYYNEMKKNTITELNNKNKTYEEKILNINLDDIVKDFELFNALIHAQDKDFESLLNEKDTCIEEYLSLINLFPQAFIILNHNFEIIKENKKFNLINSENNLINKIITFVGINNLDENPTFKFNTHKFLIKKYEKDNLLYFIVLEKNNTKTQYKNKNFKRIIKYKILPESII